MRESLQSQLEAVVRGRVRFDPLTRAIYSTDASIYEIRPTAVVIPKDIDDVRAVVDVARKAGTSIVARGAGTGLVGGAIGPGILLDFPHFMNRILAIDPETRTARVQPGVVLDALNAHLAAHGLHFAPDVATSGRATIGGMIANNSCGAHSIVFGTTVDHVAALTVVLADGSVARWPQNAAQPNPRARAIQKSLTRIVATYFDEIAARFPKTHRRNGGYALDRLADSAAAIDPTRLLCGSEGTLALIVEAELRLTPLPKHRGLLLIHFADLLESMSAVPIVLKHNPAAVELVDRMLLDAARRDPGSAAAARGLIEQDADAVHIVEFFADDFDELGERLRLVDQSLTVQGAGYSRRVVVDPVHQHAVWNMRKRGLGLLMSRPGDANGGAFVEDTAVPPDRLRDYIVRFAAILREEGVRETGYYAHAGAGEIHVRPGLDLKTAQGVVQLHRIADRISSLALEFGGSNSGEHGDGIVRSCWNEKMFGATIVRAFKEVKQAFDPENLFNPGKIVDPMSMTEHLRFGTDYAAKEVKTHFDFREHGGFAGSVEMCSGVGECRKTLTGTMCPSYVATHDESHTTRARANALRAALSNRGMLDGLDDPALDEVMELCLLCKACKTECPTGVDMARMKTEWLSRRNMRLGVSRGDRFTADAPRLAQLGSRLPRLANLLLQSNAVRAVLERLYGLDRRILPPRFATETFRQWFRRHKRSVSLSEPRTSASGSHIRPLPNVVYFVDTWTNFYTPQVGVAAVRLLESAGFNVVLSDVECCGRTLISKGLLAEARYLAEQNIRRLEAHIDAGTPIVGTEPSCILTLADEYPQLVRSADAARLAPLSRTIEAFLVELSATDAARMQDRFSHSSIDDRPTNHILYHAHCHQKALVGSASALRLLNMAGYKATEINSGCCGMAGAFGHEKPHYDVARAIGEDRLFPAVRECGDARIAVSGFSCREQLAHHTGVEAMHVVELLADSLLSNVVSPNG